MTELNDGHTIVTRQDQSTFIQPAAEKMDTTQLSERLLTLLPYMVKELVALITDYIALYYCRFAYLKEYQIWQTVCPWDPTMVSKITLSFDRLHPLILTSSWQLMISVTDDKVGITAEDYTNEYKSLTVEYMGTDNVRFISYDVHKYPCRTFDISPKTTCVNLQLKLENCVVTIVNHDN
jgi:hypothetical protein